MYNGNRYGKLTATKLIKGQPTKLIKILAYINKHPYCSKYEIVRNVLGKKGTNFELRGYYCTNFVKMRCSDLIELNWDMRTYTLGETGKQALVNYPVKV